MSETVHIPTLLAGQFGISRSEGRRLIAQGAVKVNGAQLTLKPPYVPGRTYPPPRPDLFEDVEKIKASRA